MLKEIFRLKLMYLSRFYLKKKPNTVIGILGTEGKKFVRHYLRKILQIEDKNLGLFSYNTEIGLPLSIFQINAPTSKSIKAWGNVLVQSISKALTKYPQELMILEYGLKEHPDSQNLLKICHPDIFILHNINKNENYLPLETESEFKKFLQTLDKQKIGIFNFDEPIAKELSQYFPGKKYFYTTQRATPALKKEQYLQLNAKGKITQNITKDENKLKTLEQVKDYIKDNESERSALAGAMLVGLVKEKN